MRRDYVHDLIYINWKTETVVEGLYIRQMKELEEKLLAIGIEAHSNTVRADWIKPYTYKIETKGYFKHLYIRLSDNKLHHFQTHLIDDSKNCNGVVIRHNLGSKCNRILQEKFKELNGLSTMQAFGYCDREIIHKCVPKQLYYINQNLILKKLKNISKADYVSHYPSNIFGDLPEWRKHKILSGTVPPNEDFPFAFYPRSGHIAELGRFDTHNWLDHKLNFCLFGENFENIPLEEDYTILCKKSLYTMEDTYMYFFNKRKSNTPIEDNIFAKDVLNSTIGYMHLKNIKSKNNRLDHLAAVVIARSNQKMLDTIDHVGLKNVIMVVVDSVIYKGNWELGSAEKEIGTLRQEITGADFIMRGTNQYMFFRDGILLEERHGGFNKNLIFDTPEDIMKWEKENVTLKIEL